MREDKYLPPGTRVRHDGFPESPEFGVVVHCWHSDEIGGFDCYVAFFGGEFPSAAPPKIPYVLRYAALSLTVVA